MGRTCDPCTAVMRSPVDCLGPPSLMCAGSRRLLPEVSSRNCCSRNCAAGSTASGTAAGPTFPGRAPTVWGSEFSCHPSFHQFNRGNGSPRPPASTLSCSLCFLTSTPGRSFAHVPCPSLPAIPTGHGGNV